VDREPYEPIAFERLADQLGRGGLDVARVVAELQALRIETPSWGYGNTGTRFHVFPSPGAARNIQEKLEDAAKVHQLTGACPRVALHIPWDRVDDWARLGREMEDVGLRVGAINPNLFQDDAYKLGSLTHPDIGVRRQALGHVTECITIAQTLGSDVVSLWLADGTNYAGQDDIRSRKHRLEDALADAYSRLPRGMRLLIEYKCFEPAFYHTDVADWGTAYALATKLGPQAEVLVDTGHHLPGANIEQIVAFLLDERRLGGFHFNARRYADDDLIVGSANPFELCCILLEVRHAIEAPDVEGHARRVAYMIDQSHNIEPKVEAMVQSVVNVQDAYARAWLVDRQRLAAAQGTGDVLGAHRALTDAFAVDVRPLTAEARRRMGAEPDPVGALRRSGYAAEVARRRGMSVQDGGYPR